MKSLPRIPRCCGGHTDLRILAEHVLRDFPGMAEEMVRRELGRARSAVTAVMAQAEDEGLVITELIARNQLLLLTGERADAAHLDPQRHPTRPGAGEAP